MPAYPTLLPSLWPSYHSTTVSLYHVCNPPFLTQIEHLQETARVHHAQLQELRRAAEDAEEERDAAVQEQSVLRGQVEQFQRGNELLQDKLRLYTGETGVDMNELERALTLVKRRQEVPTDVDFLEKPERPDDLDEMDGIPALRRKVQTLQVRGGYQSIDYPTCLLVVSLLLGRILRHCR